MLFFFAFFMLPNSIEKKYLDIQKNNDNHYLTLQS